MGVEVKLKNIPTPSFKELHDKLGSATIKREWTYFQNYARRFDGNTEDKRYGILIMGQKGSWENMVYAPDPLELRRRHLAAIDIFKTGDPGESQRNFLNWLEKMEGK